MLGLPKARPMLCSQEKSENDDRETRLKNEGDIDLGNYVN